MEPNSKKFDALTDIVERVQKAEQGETESPTPKDQQVSNSKGETITLGDGVIPDIF